MVYSQSKIEDSQLTTRPLIRICGLINLLNLLAMMLVIRCLYLYISSVSSFWVHVSVSASFLTHSPHQVLYELIDDLQKDSPSIIVSENISLLPVMTTMFV